MIHVKRMVALRTTQAFSMQHITSRGCRLDPLELESSCAQEGRILQTTSPSPSLHSWPLPALQWRWVQTLGGQPLLDVSKDPLWSLAGTRCCLPPFVAPTNPALCALWPPPSPTQHQHAVAGFSLFIFLNAHWLSCSPSPPTHLTPHLLLFQLCCSRTQGPNKTLHRMVNVLNNMKAWWHQHTLKHGS